MNDSNSKKSEDKTPQKNFNLERTFFTPFQILIKDAMTMIPAKNVTVLYTGVSGCGKSWMGEWVIKNLTHAMCTTSIILLNLVEEEIKSNDIFVFDGIADLGTNIPRVDTMLRQHADSSLPFGGKTVLFLGQPSEREAAATALLKLNPNHLMILG